MKGLMRLPGELIFLCLFYLNCQAFHHKLTKRELAHTFGVEHVDHVPDYHLVNAERSHLKDGTKRLKFDAWNDSYVLHLQPNKKLVSPNLISIIRDSNSTIEYKGLPTLDTACHYIGHVVDKNHKAAISDCQRLQGVIVTDEHFLMIQTLPERLKEEHGHHVVYKRESALINPLEHLSAEFVIDPPKVDEDEHAEFCDVSNSSISTVKINDLDQLLHLNYSIPSEAKLDSLFIFPQLDPITLEIGLFLDSQLYEHFRREFTADPEKHLTEFSLALINNVHVLYQQPTLSPNLDIVIVRFEMWKTQPPNLATHLHKNGQAQTLLDSFCRHQAKINPGTDLTDPGHWDHGVLLTGYDIYHTTPSVAGVAPVARMCDELFACSLVEGLHLGRSFVLAHEMGHNMGMVHDGVQNQCGRGCCLMSAVNGAGKTTWSTCSVREFNAFMLQLDESGKGNCLRDPSESIASHDHLKDGRLPGQRFTADQQCSYFWGREYQVEIPTGRSMDDICRILWCGNAGSTISTAHPALEGSWCGGEKWCQEGQCAPWHSLGPKPVVVNGGWSHWSSGDKQCSITPCQLTGSIAVNAQLRTCTSPAPNNGGRACSGSSIRGLVCGSTKSDCKGLSQKEYADHVCSTIKNDPSKADKQLSGIGFLHGTQPCKVWCHVSGSEVIRNKGQFPNGSPCGNGNYCVGGVCLKLGCNDKALISSSADCPEPGTPAISHAPKWEAWSDWSSCSVTCGPNGVQKRKRSCKAGEQQCQGKPTELRDCKPLPPTCINYSDWTAWYPCSASCGKGIQKKLRKCLSGECKLRLELEQECELKVCPKWSEWGDWGKCDAVCGLKGQKTRKRICEKGDCEGPKDETESCIEHCDDIGQWGTWQSCSVSCGIGFQLRQRMCDGKPCGGKQARTCNAQECMRTTDRPIWSEWSLWSTCTRTCGQGVQTRQRKCLNDHCSKFESDFEEKRCVLRPCPSWSNWEPWSSCSSCLKSLTRSRKRKCVIGLALLGDEVVEIDSHSCTGKSEETSTCDKECSPTVAVAGVPVFPVEKALNKWKEWEEWQPCSVTCGTGYRQRTRKCREGFDCKLDGTGFQVEACQEQNCEDSGNWGPWTDWSQCSATCGTGQQTRQRSCKAFFSFLCSGFSTEHKPCSASPCENEVKFLAPDWSEWSDWSHCSCFTLKRFRRRFCQIRDPSVQGFCSGSLIEQDSCQPESCLAVSGGWSSWSSWSKCSKDCGTAGHQIRNRMCSNPLPSNRGGYCVGYSFDQKLCYPQKTCSGQQVDGGWSDWTEWSTCTDPCQNGQRSRTRFCTNPTPQNDGKQCVGNDFELQPCMEPDKCGKSVDGGWAEWGNWSNCTAPCGFSFKTRQRLCTAPAPVGAGKTCTGLAYLTSVCRTSPCSTDSNSTVSSIVIGPEESEWSSWNGWRDCTMHCGKGFRSRSRSCASPVLSPGAMPCFGPADQQEECSGKDLCPQTSNHTLALEKYLAEVVRQ